MKLATFLAPGRRPSRARVRCAATRSSPSPPARVRDRLASATARPPTARPTRSPTSRCWRPVPRPRAIFGIGLNYAAHAAEQGKRAARVPDGLHEAADVERAAGRADPLPGRRRAARLRGRAGGRDRRRRPDRRLRGRRRRQRARPAAPRAAVDARQGLRHVLPVGPVDHDRRRGPRGPRARDPPWVNGEPRQDSTTDDLVFGPQELVDFIAETCTLEPGDLILTGTPQGVGVAMDPPRFLEPRRRRADRDRAPGRDRAPRQCSWMTRSIRPYSAACAAVKKRSRSMSRWTCSSGCPVCLA